MVLVDLFRIFLPGSSRILEIADQFLFLGIHAQHGAVGVFESLAKLGDQCKLPVAIGMLGLGDALAVDTQRS